MIEELYKILLKVYEESEKPFAGIGILVCDNIEKLPLIPLYDSKADLQGENISEQLLSLSNYKNKYHDGFHVVSTDLEITHIANYFYPKPHKDFYIKIDSGHGVRYFVAKLGSTLPNIKYSAIVGGEYGVCIFKDGEEIKVMLND